MVFVLSQAPLSFHKHTYLLCGFRTATYLMLAPTATSALTISMFLLYTCTVCLAVPLSCPTTPLHSRRASCSKPSPSLSLVAAGWSPTLKTPTLLAALHPMPWQGPRPHKALALHTRTLGVPKLSGLASPPQLLLLLHTCKGLPSQGHPCPGSGPGTHVA